MVPFGNDGEAASRSGHGDIEQAARRIGVLAFRGPVPPAIQDDDVIKLHTFRSMRRQQQQRALIAAGIIGPFSEPLDKVRHRHGLVRKLFRQRRDAFGDQVRPAVRRYRVEHVHQIADGQQTGSIAAQVVDELLHLPQTPDAGQALVCHLHRNAKHFSIGPHRSQPPPVTCDDRRT